MKSLGYSFYVSKGKCQLTVHPKSKAKMKAKLKELTPDIFSVTIQFHKNVNPLSNFINLYYTHAIPKIQPQPHLREKKETAILEKQI